MSQFSCPGCPSHKGKTLKHTRRLLITLYVNALYQMHQEKLKRGEKKEEKEEGSVKSSSEGDDEEKKHEKFEKGTL